MTLASLILHKRFQSKVDGNNAVYHGNLLIKVIYEKNFSFPQQTELHVIWITFMNERTYIFRYKNEENLQFRRR